MKSSRLFAIALLLFVLVAPVSVAARGQSESKPAAATKQTVVMDIRVVEADADGAAELQRSGSDKKRLDDLIASGKASLIAELELQGAYNRTVSAHVGRRVPIQVGSQPIATRADARGGEPAAFGFGIPQIQYEDTGLRVSAAVGTPVNGKILIGLDLALNEVSSRSATLTPVLMRKSIDSMVTVREGEMVPILSIMERSGVELAEPRPGSTPARPPLRFMVLLTAHSVE
jgi:hypothetical protein